MLVFIVASVQLCVASEIDEIKNNNLILHRHYIDFDQAQFRESMEVVGITCTTPIIADVHSLVLECDSTAITYHFAEEQQYDVAALYSYLGYENTSVYLAIHGIYVEADDASINVEAGVAAIIGMDQTLEDYCDYSLQVSYSDYEIFEQYALQCDVRMGLIFKPWSSGLIRWDTTLRSIFQSEDNYYAIENAVTFYVHEWGCAAWLCLGEESLAIQQKGLVMVNSLDIEQQSFGVRSWYRWQSGYALETKISLSELENSNGTAAEKYSLSILCSYAW
ncbi:MAG: hypothetical protein HRU15_07500 [Planctomycetes bacterium]|nr:hypothetical protein [Planctomycetota bacterium]